MNDLCHDCATPEGHLHEWGCDMERCPRCGGQLIGCGCWLCDGGFTTEDMREIEAVGRVPYICWPNLCARCGALWPSMFTVPNEEWHKYVEIAERDTMLCRPCYDKIAHLIDQGTPQ